MKTIKSAEEFITLVSHDNPAERQKAMNSHIPDSICLRIIQQYPEARRCLVWNKKLSLKVLIKLAKSRDRFIRHDVAFRPCNDKEVWKILAKDKSSFVRERVACNPATPLDVLVDMYPDGDAEIDERLELRLGMTKPNIEHWMGLEEGKDGEFRPFIKGTRSYQNRRRATIRFLKQYCLPFRENETDSK